MENVPAKRAAGGAAIVAVLAIGVVLLPLLYVLSVGPIVWLYRTGRIDAGQNSVIARIYFPLEWAAETVPPFGTAIEWYVSLWEPPTPPVLSAPLPNPVPPPPPPPSAPPVARTNPASGL